MVAGLFAVIFIFPQNAFAAGPFKGDAHVQATGALGATRDFYFRTVNDSSTPTNRASWQLDAGASIDIFYRDTPGDTPATAPTTVVLEVRSDNGATVVRQFLNGAEPANADTGITYTFFATSDGTSGGTPKAGMYRLYINAICAGAGCLTGTYNVTSDSNGDKGALRGGIKVSDITKNVYPAGSAYAYGSAGDETMTFTAATTDRFEDTGTNQTVRVNTHRFGAAVGADILQGTSGEFATAGNAQSDTCDNTYNPSTGTTYDVEYEITGFSLLLPAEKWTHIASAGNGASITRNSDTFATYTNGTSGRFSCDPAIRFSSSSVSPDDNIQATTFTKYNRGESVATNFYLFNARSEKLSRAMTIGYIGSDGTTGSTAASVTPSSNLYTATQTLLSTAKATNDTTGDLHVVRATNTDQTKDSSANINGFSVSSKYFVTPWTQLNTAARGATETTSGIIAADTFNFFARVQTVRQDSTIVQTSGSALTFTLKKPDGTTRTAPTADTGSNGWTPDNTLNFSLEAPAGSWTITPNVSFSGNSGTATENITAISPYVGNYLVEYVGWNQTYSLGNTARFTIQTQQRNSSTGNFDAVAAGSAPTYTLRYWDGDLSQWIAITSGTMTALSPTGTYEATYIIPSTSAWAGRKVSFSASAVIGGTRINDAREIEIVSSPAQVVINSITDAAIPTISASVRITNEGTAAFEYTYEYCMVTSDANQCGGGDDVAYGSAAKLIQAGANFDTTLTLNVTQTGNYIFKVAVWWSNQSSKSSKTFTATAESVSTPASSGGGGGGGGTVTPTPQPAEQNTFVVVWQKITEIFARLLGIENRVSGLEARVASLERQLGQRAAAPTPRREISVPTAPRQAPKVEAPTKPFFKIRLQ